MFKKCPGDPDTLLSAHCEHLLQSYSRQTELHYLILFSCLPLTYIAELTTSVLLKIVLLSIKL